MKITAVKEISRCIIFIKGLRAGHCTQAWKKADLYSGILRFLSVPRIRITVFAPHGMDEITVTTASGDVEFYETDADKVTGKSASGDIRLETVRTGHGTFSTLSGDVKAHSVMGREHFVFEQERQPEAGEL